MSSQRMRSEKEIELLTFWKTGLDHTKSNLWNRLGYLNLAKVILNHYMKFLNMTRSIVHEVH